MNLTGLCHRTCSEMFVSPGITSCLINSCRSPADWEVLNAPARKQLMAVLPLTSQSQSLHSLPRETNPIDISTVEC